MEQPTTRRLGRGAGFLSGGAILCPALAFLGWPGSALAATPVVLTFQSGNIIVLSALACGGVALAVAAGLWALAEQRAARRLRRSLRAVAAKSKAAVGERDALLGAGREALVVWGRDGAGPFSYGHGEDMLQSCLKGADALALSGALDGLSDKGAAFALDAHDSHGKRLRVRGRAVGGMAAVWLDEPVAAEASGDYRAILDALPVPVWLRDKALALSWANHAYLQATGTRDLETARREQTALDKTERDLAAAARSENAVQETRLFSVVNGQRRALSFREIPLGDAGIIGTAIDVTETAAAESRLQSHVDAHADTLDKLATAVAIFGRDQKLTFYNKAFARLWTIPETWLDRHPTHGDVLDRLRDARKLPEQRDYQAWKRQRLALYQNGRESSEENWYLPNGQTVRVVSQSHPFGGLTFLYEDVSARLALESDYNTLMKVQTATLDTLSEGVAVFGPDGKLKLHNAAFERIWDMEPEELGGEPHVRTIAELARDKFGDEPQLWARVVQAVSSGARQLEDLGEVERSDRTVLSLVISPLPDGATLITFVDVTDRFRIESALRDRNEGLEAADRLKSDFIKHVSYELRTPLNTILGFSEHLASGVPGTLNPQQAEYVHAIVSGGNTLKNLVNDILDLALVESGALRLELGRVDLYDLIADVATHAREWASKMGLTLDVECPPGAGAFLGDARRLRQILFNLLSNAFKYTPRGGQVLLSGHIAGDDVQIAVSDNGPGLSPEVKANVFERFSAKSQPGSRAGAGLGLALVNRFVELHDGWVEIESEKDGGTRVRCHIPRRAPDEEQRPQVGPDQTAYL
jgi:signal transduction histidine kinase